jgi:phage terminase large subunit-like protein
MEFFRGGAEHQERCFMAANRVGKTIVGAYETTLHLTGSYPDWWPGRRFDGPGEWWAAGDTSETTRDIVQLELMGPKEDMGTGMIPARSIIGEPTARRGVADAVDQVRVKHVSGGTSVLGFKSYDQGRKKFQGTKKHGVWLDEEPEAPIYDECMLRLMTTDGLMLCTFTPLQGLTEIALRFLPDLAPVLDRGNVR